MAEGRKIDITTVIVILVVLLFLNVGGFGTQFSNWLKSEAASVSGDAEGGACLYDRTTMTVGKMVDIFRPANDVTSEYSRVFINNADRGLYIDGSAITVTPNVDEIDVYYAINSSGYYTNFESFLSPCKSAFSTAEIGESYRLYKSGNEDATNTSDFVSCWNFNDATKITSSAKQSVSAGTYTNIRCEIGVPEDETFSPIGKAAVCLEFESGNFSEIPRILDGKTVISPSYLRMIFGSNSIRCYELDTIINDKISFQIMVLPANDAPGDITLNFIDQDYFRHSQTREMLLGYQDDLGKNVGTLYDVVSTIYLI